MIACHIKTLKGQYKAENEWGQLITLIEAGELRIPFITIRVTIGQKESEEIAIEGSIEPTVGDLFLFSSLALLQGQDFSFDYWDQEGTVYMTHEGNNIVIAGDYLVATSFPKQVLIKSFLDGARKMMDLMRDLHEQYPEIIAAEHTRFEELHAEATALYNRKYG